MRKSVIPLAVFGGALLGVSAVLLTRSHGNDGASNTSVRMSIQPSAEIADQPERWSPPNADRSIDRQEIPATLERLQEFSGPPAGSKSEAAHEEDFQLSTKREASELDQADTDSEVGLESFRLSLSVEDRCRTRPAPTVESCVEVMKLLDEMSHEERDLGWATRTELRLRAVVSARKDETQIRALECKASICAIETQSQGQPHFVILSQAEQEFAQVIDDGDYVLAWEENPNLGKVTITVRLLTRRMQ
jgi:hypothetical protein